MQTCLQHQDEEQWAKDKALMHAISNANFLTALKIDPHNTSGIGVQNLDVTYRPFLHPEAP